MKLRNENFAIALDWLGKNKGVDGQKGLAQITGISQNTISRIMTGKVEPSDDTLRKLNDAFKGIFNMNFLRGNSIIMLAEDELYYSLHPREHPLYEQEDTRQQKTDAEPNADLLELYAQRIRLVDDLRASLKEELAEVHALRTELQQARDDFRDATYRLTRTLAMFTVPTDSPVGLAAESIT
jgi:transcriptional regulator with XRE-family HTH domain